jgi:hypothetical protein
VRLKDDQLRQENLLLTLLTNKFGPMTKSGRHRSPKLSISQLCFMHLPKTAGTSIRSYLRESLPSARCFQGADWAFDLVSAVDLAQFDLIMGHFCFRHTQKFSQGHRLITFVREPIDRVLSGYFFMREMPDDVLTSMFEENICSAAKNLSLTDFLQSRDPSVRRFVRNQQSRAIASDDREDEPSDGSLLGRAIANLEHFFYVGTAEQLSVVGVSTLSQRLGSCEGIALRHLNKTTIRPRSDEISAADRQLIADLNSIDMELYAAVCAKLEGRLPIRQDEIVLPSERGENRDQNRVGGINSFDGTFA